MRQKGIIFDLDGVICHTDQYHYLAWKQLADSIGVPFDETCNDRMRGVSRMDSLEILLEKSGRTYTMAEKCALAERKNECYKNLLKRMSPRDLEDTVFQTLERLRQRNVLLAIGSSSKNAQTILSQLGLGEYFDAVSDGNGLQRAKPDPEVFLKAAVKLGLPASECLVVEDAAAGIAAAHAAGMSAAAIGELTANTDAEFLLGDFSDLLNILDEGKAPGNYDILRERLALQRQWTKADGVYKCVKQVPDQWEAGHFDPRVQIERAKPEKQFAKPSQICFEEFPVGAWRQQDGWNNFDIVSDCDVHQTTVYVPDGNRGTILCEAYAPAGAAGPLPCIVFLHGGGFYSGSVRVVRNPCRALAVFANAMVVNVDYTRAPEAAFPDAIQEGATVVRWLAANADELRIDVNRIGVAGDSAGGALAAGIAYFLRNAGDDLVGYQALLYPVVILDEAAEHKLCPWSREAYDIAPDDTQILHAMDYIRSGKNTISALYLQGADPANPLASPLCALWPERPPRTLVVTAQYDYLRLQDEAYTKKLLDAGGEVRLIEYQGMDHAFVDKIGFYPQAEDCIRMIAEDFGNWCSSVG